MPRYFFHLAGGGFTPDPQGSEYRDVQDARIQAIAYAADTLRDSPEIVWAGQTVSLHVTDDTGDLVFTVTISAGAPS